MPLRFSIQNSLLIAFLLLGMLLLAAITLTWRAFNEVEKQQQVLIEYEIPKSNAIGAAIDDGLALLDVGFLLSRELTTDEYNDTQARARQLIIDIQDDLAFFSQDGQAIDGLVELEANTQALINAIDEQLVLRKQVIDNDLIYTAQRQALGQKINVASINAKLVTSNMELESPQQSDISSELLFAIERIRDIVDALIFINSPTFLQQEKNQYRLSINRLSFQLAEFPSGSRRELSQALLPLLDTLTDEVNIFALRQDRLQLVESLSVLQGQISSLSIRLNEQYRQISLNSSDTVETNANFLLDTVLSSKNNLLIFFAFFFLLVLLLFYYFVKPRIVERLRQLNHTTLAIANGDLATKVDVRGDDEVSDMAQSLAYFRDELVKKEKTQQALASNEKNLSTIIQNASEGLFTVDIDGRIQSFNPACELMFDANAEDVLDQSVTQILPQQISLFKHHEQQISDDGFGIVVCERQKVLVNTYAGGLFAASLSVTLIRLSGRLLYSCFIRDISDEELAKKQLDDLVQELSSSNADLESFAYSCSHDLQEPIRMVASFSDLLQKHLEEQNSLDETSQRYLGFITEGSLNAKQLVKDILEYSRLEQGAGSKEWFVVNDVFEQICSMMHGMLKEKNGQFLIEGGNVQLLAIPAQFKQLLMNLMVNGLKYNKSKQPTVTVRINEEAQHWLIAVIDNGIGVDPAYHDKMFGLFARLVSRRDYSGSGIGLSLCKKIVDKHNGTITVKSAIGEGACFEVQLPKFEQV